ncbi:MAG: endonuclease/exonuclease/phosphatase family protein [Betaproteobacteria bacterium]|nr:endonuclease/exonuclease/phosphatase family protein [Betaproteobacteria bacterium]
MDKGLGVRARDTERDHLAAWHAPQGTRVFKFVQFNMQFGQRWDDLEPDLAPVDLDLTIAEMRAQQADIIVLQELEQAQPGGIQPDPPPNYTRLRSALTDYDSFFSYPKPDPRELPFGIGLAIFSRTPLRELMRRDLPSPPIEFEFRGEKRTPTDRLLIGAKTTLGGRDLRVFNTHLLAFFMLNASCEEYRHQRELVVKELGASDGPTLVAGDFNVHRHEPLVRQFAEAGYRAVQTEEVTWRRRPYVLDHIFYSPQLRLLRHAVEHTPASDHHLLAAEFEFID